MSCFSRYHFPICCMLFLPVEYEVKLLGVFDHIHTVVVILILGDVLIDEEGLQSRLTCAGTASQAHGGVVAEAKRQEVQHVRTGSACGDEYLSGDAVLDLLSDGSRHAQLSRDNRRNSGCDTGAGADVTVHLRCLCILDRYGFKRVQHVLANTVMEKSDDGRFDPSNRAWAEKQGVMPDAEHNFRFAVDSHPAVVNGFLHVVRDAYSSLHLFEAEDCDTIWQELKGKVLVMKPSTLKESYWSQENQLWVATSGFGCSPSAVGRAVYATCLGDGEDNVRWNREDFLGVLKDELLPDWAREQLDKLNSGQKIGPVDAGSVQVISRPKPVVLNTHKRLL